MKNDFIKLVVFQVCGLIESITWNYENGLVWKVS